MNPKRYHVEIGGQIWTLRRTTAALAAEAAAREAGEAQLRRNGGRVEVYELTNPTVFTAKSKWDLVQNEARAL